MNYNIKKENTMKKRIALLLSVAMCATLCLSGCGSSEKKTGDKKDASSMVYAVEQGSAGEEAAKSKGWSTNPVQSQAKALMEVNSGTSDAAIIDLLMAGAMIGEGTSYPDLKYTDKLTTEEYGVGCRKGSDLAAYINNFFSEIYASGEMKTIADTYKVSDTLVEQAKAGEYVEGNDVKYIKDKGTLVVGITEFEPMDYKDEDGNWIGFDADLAKKLAEKLGVKIKFVVINWDTKTMELDSKKIDVVWNGMTLTNEVKNSMECTNAYCNNAQVVVVSSCLLYTSPSPRDS